MGNRTVQHRRADMRRSETSSPTGGRIRPSAARHGLLVVVVVGLLLAGCGSDPGPAADATVPAVERPAAEVVDAPAAESPVTPEVATDPQDVEVAEPPVVEPEDPAPAVSLAEVDWGTLGWRTDCTLSGEVETIFLDVPDEPGASWPDGWLQHDPHPEFPSMIFTVQAGAPTVGMATLDGRDVAVFEANCFLGNDSVDSLEAWTTDADGQPVQLPRLLLLSKYDGQLTGVEVTDGLVRVSTVEGEPGAPSPHISGYPIEVVTEWLVVEDRWQGRVISRVDTRAAGSGGGQQAPAGQQPDSAASSEAPTDVSWCDQAAQSPEALVRCLVAASNIGEPERAAGLATGEVLDRLAQERADLVLNWEFTGCDDDGVCWLYEPVDNWIHGLGIEVQVDPTDDGYLATFLEIYG